MIKKCSVNMMGKNDFIIISTDMIHSLVGLIKASESKRLKINIGGIVSSTYSEYMLNVLNTNRKKKPFWFRDISTNKLVIDDFYQITAIQFEKLMVEGEACFKSCKIDCYKDDVNIQLDIHNKFYDICKDVNSSISFAYPYNK